LKSEKPCGRFRRAFFWLAHLA